MTYPNKGKTNNTFSFMRIRPTYTIKNPFFIGLCFKNMYTPMCLHSHTYTKMEFILDYFFQVKNGEKCSYDKDTLLEVPKE